MNTAFWRRWHRWIGFPAGLFLLFASITGLLVAASEFFGEEEALREATRDQVSTVTTASAATAAQEALRAALATAAATAPGAPVDKIELQLKGNAPTVTVFTGKPAGGEDRRLVFNLRTGALMGNERYADKPLLNRIHSGEWFGDGGLVAAMLWALALAGLTVSGLYIYWTMRRPNQSGWRQLFW